MTQYYDNSGHIQNSASLGGTWLDTAPYPHAGDVVDPLKNAAIQGSVLRGIAANGWTITPEHLFIVYTAPGMTVCFDSKDCTPGTLSPVWCAYHSWFSQNSAAVIYAVIPYVGSWGENCRTFEQSPNDNIEADTAIDSAFHEISEALTDPTGTGWVSDQKGVENADPCTFRYGPTYLAPNGTHANANFGGRDYLFQTLWINGVPPLRCAHKL